MFEWDRGMSVADNWLGAPPDGQGCLFQYEPGWLTQLSTQAIFLVKYNINQETYQLQFRGAEVGEEDTTKELYICLCYLSQRWVQPQYHTKEETGETIISEQFLRLISPELQVWIKEHNPASAVEAATLVDVQRSGLEISPDSLYLRRKAALRVWG